MSAPTVSYGGVELEALKMLPAAQELKDKGYKILVVNLPITGEWVYRRFMESLLSMTAGEGYLYFLADKIKILTNICCDFPIDYNRNKSIRTAIEVFGADYIMQMDTDQTFQRGGLMRLWESLHKEVEPGLEPEVVAGMYFMKSHPWRPVLGPYTGWDVSWDKSYFEKIGFSCRGECGDAKHKDGQPHQLVRWAGANEWPEDRLFRVDVIGVGCALSRASMWKKLKYPFFRYSPDPIKGMVKGDQVEISEDMHWCANMHKAGVKVWIDPLVQCGHIGILESNRELYLGGWEALKLQVEKLPQKEKDEFKKQLVDLR